MAFTQKVVSNERIFPSTYRSAQDQSTETLRLSTLDATTVFFSDCAAVWYFEADGKGENIVTPLHLKESLKLVLERYHYFCGRLGLLHSEHPAHQHRYGRVGVQIRNAEVDPGVEFSVVQDSRILDEVIPSLQQRSDSAVPWRRTPGVCFSFLSKTELAFALNDDETSQGPAVAIQITSFSCGALALGIKIAHVFSDAISMGIFVRDWAEASRLLFAQKPQSKTVSRFPSPSPVDEAVSGNPNETSASSTIIGFTDTLPVHRYDWWASRIDCPVDIKATRLPEPLKNIPNVLESRGKRIPWQEWDMAAEVQHCVIHFEEAEIQRIQKLASSYGAHASLQVSLIAHLWSCINRARHLSEDDYAVYCDLSFGLRPKLGLSSEHTGSPLMNAAVPSTSREASDYANLPLLASTIKSTLDQLDTRAIGALLHRLHYEDSPQRIWQCFLGNRHILSTSWVHAGLYDVDFHGGKPSNEGGTNLRFVDPVFQNVDGIVNIIESAAPANGLGKGWAHKGVDVILHLESSAMDRLLEDNLLKPCMSN